ncbi:hypothetical protein PG985_000798 [Apiospora marii]|uniref:Protein kinase domain-containing protein n=1 Tax=Apiospora marii TaxID=335849 RepID=A0ABR1R453_9PEZI
MASDKPNAVLSFLPLNGGGSTVRVRVDNLIRYVKIPSYVLDHEPDMLGGPNPKVLALDYPSGVKCLEIHRGPVLAIRPLQFELKGVEGVSLPISHDYETFEVLEPLLTGVRDRLCVVKHPDLKEHGKMVMKIAEMPENWISPDGTVLASLAHQETSIAKEFRMQREIVALGLGLAPEIIGLVTEKGRGAIGFLMEYIEGARSFNQLNREGVMMTNAEKEGFRHALRLLHDHGFIHGDINSGNLMRRPNGPPMMIDYEKAQRVNSEGHAEDFPGSPQEIERGTLKSWMEILSSL